MYNKCLLTSVSHTHLSVSACKKQARKPRLAGLGGFGESCQSSPGRVLLPHGASAAPSPPGCVVLGWGAHGCRGAAFQTPNPVQNPGSVPMVSMACPKHQLAVFAASLDAKDRLLVIETVTDAC